jgi:RNA polymerase sigma factor (sigma-70 family)
MTLARSRWRAFAEDAEVGSLVDHVVVAQRDAAVARASLERLLALCRPVAEQIARTYVRDDDDVSDMIQESLAAAARHLPELRDPRAFPYWFATLAHNTCRQWLRGEARHRRRRFTPAIDADVATGWEHLDLQDPHSDAAFDAVHVRDAVAPLLRLLPPRERGIVARAYLDDQPQREIARREDLSAKAVENVVYRALRRLRTVVAQCGDEYQELALWCPLCGRERLLARLEPGHGPAWPIRVRSACPGCAQWRSGLGLPLARYPTLEAALIQGVAGLGAELRDVVRSPAPRCPNCGQPMTQPPAASDLLDQVSWTCHLCSTYGAGGLETIAASVPAWRAFWQATPRMRFGPKRVVERDGEARVELTAWDAASGRTGTLVLSRGTLEARRFEEGGR